VGAETLVTVSNAVIMGLPKPLVMHSNLGVQVRHGVKDRLISPYPQFPFPWFQLCNFNHSLKELN
jgi:hypothetical protein